MQLALIKAGVESIGIENSAERTAYAWSVTASDPLPLIVFIVLLLLVLLSMSIFRSPAVALMPDVTPKPLRSKANAVINLMGSAGGIIVLVLGILFGTGKPENAIMSYSLFFGVVAAIMITALAIFLLTVREVKWSREADKINSQLTNDEKTSESESAKDKSSPGASAPEKSSELSRGQLKSLIFILASVVLWYMGYNAVTSKYSVYAGDIPRARLQPDPDNRAGGGDRGVYSGRYTFAEIRQKANDPRRSRHARSGVRIRRVHAGGKQHLGDELSVRARRNRLGYYKRQ